MCRERDTVSHILIMVGGSVSLSGGQFIDSKQYLHVHTSSSTFTSKSLEILSQKYSLCI